VDVPAVEAALSDVDVPAVGIRSVAALCVVDVPAVGIRSVAALSVVDVPAVGIRSVPEQPRAVALLSVGAGVSSLPGLYS